MNFFIGFLLGFLFSVAMGFIAMILDERAERERFKQYFEEIEAERKKDRKNKSSKRQTETQK